MDEKYSEDATLEKALDIENKDEKVSYPKLPGCAWTDRYTFIFQACRLDPTVPQNMDTWFYVRMKIIEDDFNENSINTSLSLINAQIFIALFIMIWLVTKVEFVKIFSGSDNKHSGLTDTIILSFIILGVLILPILTILNKAVSIH